MRVAVAGTPYEFLQAADDPSLLAAALRAGVALEYECNSGGCGTCRIKVLHGEARATRVDPPGLSERDRRRGVMLACQTLAAGDLTIEARVRSTPDPIPPRRRRAQPLDARPLTADMRAFRFTTGEAAEFLPGQYALLECGGARRAYSMSNLPNEDGLWEFVIKRVPGGEFTEPLFDGEPRAVVIDGPYGFAHVRPESTRDVLCVAGGSGLSPILSIVRSLAAQDGAPRAIDVFYGGRTAADLCLERALAEALVSAPHIRLHSVVSDPEHASSRGWSGATGFVHDAVVRHLGDSVREREIYFAGPPPMATATQRALVLDLRVPVEQIHFDRFF